MFANEWDDASGESIHDAFLSFRHVPSITSVPFFAGQSFFRRSSQLIDPSEFDILGTFGCVCPLGGVEWVQSVHRAWLERSSLFRRRFSKGWWKQRLNPAHAFILRLESRHFRPGNYRKLIALTPEVKNDLMRLYGVPTEDIVLLPNGFSPREFNLQRRHELRVSVRQELGYSQSDRVVVFVANELERKGFGPLLRAVEALGNPKIHLLAVGRFSPGSYPDMAAQHGLTSRVKFVGSSDDVARYYAAADAFALPPNTRPGEW